MPDGEVALRLREVTKRYGERLVLDGASLDVPRGRLVAVAGPSGVGKTTVLELLLGWAVPDAGVVERAEGLGPGPDGTIPWGATAVVPQQRGLLPELSVRDNVGLPLRLGGAPDEARTSELLEALGLAALARRRPSELSLGEQQRTSVARALVAAPAVVLADEPTAHQDAGSARAVLDALRGAVDGGAACLVVSHHRLVLDHADEVVALSGGRLLAPSPGVAANPSAGGRSRS